MTTPKLPGLSVLGVHINTDMPNFRPNTWPPEDDFPVVIDSEGKVVSRYGDIRWDFSSWHGSVLKIYFGDGPGNGHKVSKENANLLRLVTAWWIWGPGVPVQARTIVSRFETIKPFFVICSNHNICVSELSKYPEVIKEIATKGKFSHLHLLTYLHDISFNAKKLGFNILDEEGMKIFNKYLNINEPTQTAYIPPRIWSYQLTRLKECLDSYLQNKEKLERFFIYCLLAYEPSHSIIKKDSFKKLTKEFDLVEKFEKGIKSTRMSIKDVAIKFGVYCILEKWVITNNKCTLETLSNYLNLINFCGTAYIANFSLMRISECSRLRIDCLQSEVDETGGEIWLIKGLTTKTIQDKEASWIVPSTVKDAIDAMRHITELRLTAAKHNSQLTLNKKFLANPTLQCHAYEAWRVHHLNVDVEYITPRTYQEVCKKYPKLFNQQTMTITKEDLDIARRLTANLNPELYNVGKIWPLSWHQLRRTGAVNMLASGLVSEFSLQYQLKHASLAMSRYYGQNYYKLKAPLNSEARGLYLKEMYETITREFRELQSENYISPHGNKRKEQVLSEITEKDHKQLINAAKKGKISYRETFLGGCANQGPPCPYGGISNITSCMGFDDKSACNAVILDKSKLPVINKLKDSLQIQLTNADDQSPLHQSLKAQIESAERAINVINTIQI